MQVKIKIWRFEDSEIASFLWKWKLILHGLPPPLFKPNFQSRSILWNSFFFSVVDLVSSIVIFIFICVMAFHSCQSSVILYVCVGLVICYEVCISYKQSSFLILCLGSISPKSFIATSSYHITEEFCNSLDQNVQSPLSFQ